MKVVFRTDSSALMGTGHLMRCLTLADELKKNGADISFICRNHPGNISNIVEKKGYKLYRLDTIDSDFETFRAKSIYKLWLGVDQNIDAAETIDIIENNIPSVDWLITDHYGIDIEWENKIKQRVSALMVIDDLADRSHSCDLILNQNPESGEIQRYRDLVPGKTTVLHGTDYAMLRPEFINARRNMRKGEFEINRILVYFGGSDPENMTGKTLQALNDPNLTSISVDVICGPSNEFKDEIKTICDTMNNAVFYEFVDNIAEIMVNADLAVGAGGTATWERCCLGLPAIIISIAENQETVCAEAEKYKFGKYLGKTNDITVEMLRSEIKKLLKNPEELKEMSESGMNLVDGAGVERVAAAMINYHQKENAREVKIGV